MFGVNVDLNLKDISAKGTQWGTEFKTWWTQHWEDVGTKIYTKMTEISIEIIQYYCLTGKLIYRSLPVGTDLRQGR